jgi:hypothetical protein
MNYLIKNSHDVIDIIFNGKKYSKHIYKAMFVYYKSDWASFLNSVKGLLLIKRKE